MEFNADQQKVLKALSAGKDALATGGPGTGKTMLLIEYAAKVVTENPNSKVAIVCFAFRTAKYTESLLAQKYANLLHSGQIRVSTAKDYAQTALESAEGAPKINFAGNSRVRSMLRIAMSQVQFKGSVNEAEHIIRNFRAQLKNPQVDARHFPLFEAYKNLMEQAGYIDRHTIIRKHIVAIDNGTAALAPYTHILVDHIQDITPIQLRWVLAHQQSKGKKGAQLLCVGDDDQTLYATNGAMGAGALHKLSKTKGFEAVTLTTGYNTPKTLAPKVHKLPRLLLERVGKQQTEHNPAPAEFQVKELSDFPTEWAFLQNIIQNTRKSAPKSKIGMLVRTHEQAARFGHLCSLANLPHASYGRPVWEQYGAQVALSTLYLLLGQAQPSQLTTVLHVMGVSATLQATLVQAPQLEQGIGTWLQTGLQLPELTPSSTITTEDIATLRRARRMLSGTWQAIQQRKINPKDAFLALMQQALPRLSDEHKQYALLATDMLANIQGPLREELQTLLTETLPDTNAPIIIAPVREARNMAFDMLILPTCHASQWPLTQGAVMTQDTEHERRLFYTALARAKGHIICTSSSGLSPYLGEIQVRKSKV